jgi:hypothetical protein
VKTVLVIEMLLAVQSVEYDKSVTFGSTPERPCRLQCTALSGAMELLEGARCTSFAALRQCVRRLGASLSSELLRTRAVFRTRAQRAAGA